MGSAVLWDTRTSLNDLHYPLDAPPGATQAMTTPSLAAQRDALLEAIKKAMIEIAEIKCHDPLPAEQLAKISKETAAALGHAMGIMDACVYLKAAIASVERGEEQEG